jgi:apolipoprotein N-acyltransferase
VLERLPVFEPASAVIDVRRLDGTTFYLRFGPVFAWIASALAAIVVFRGGGRV